MSRLDAKYFELIVLVILAFGFLFASAGCYVATMEFDLAWAIENRSENYVLIAQYAMPIMCVICFLAFGGFTWAVDKCYKDILWYKERLARVKELDDKLDS